MTEEELMRSTLRADAASVRHGTDLAERIITRTTDEPTVRHLDHARPPAWRNWVLPAVAAVTVAILIGAALLARGLFNSAGNTSPARPSQSSLPTPPPSTQPPPSTKPSPSTPGKPATTPAQVGPVGGPVPAGFHAVDLTWISADEGWAIGTAPCSTAPCTSMVRTQDGGRTWVGIHAPSAELSQQSGCAAPCIGHLRFASPLIGYAFGTSTLFMTVDGGDHWSRQPGGADALEIANGTVLRVTGQMPGCVPGCRYQLQRAGLGSAAWSPVSLPAIAAAGDGVSLVRTGQLAAIQVVSNPAGGASNARSALLTSVDNGSTWIARGESCPQTGGGNGGNEVDSSYLTSAADGSLTVLCTPRGSVNAAFTATSTDFGASFRAAPAVLGRAVAALGGVSSHVLVAVSDAVYRSADGGSHWQRVLVDPSLPGDTASRATFIGFENSSVGRYLSADGRTAYTTADGGAHWTALQF
ncbi:MAG TPA: hypothetical protein VGH11_06000 [Jatrophihabitans sp.]